MVCHKILPDVSEANAGSKVFTWGFGSNGSHRKCFCILRIGNSKNFLNKHWILKHIVRFLKFFLMVAKHKSPDNTQNS